jgi:PKD domain
MMWILASGAAAADVDFVCTPGEGDPLVGLPPLTITCDALLPDEGTFDEITWTFGDGSVVTGSSAAFTYVEPGQYTVSVRLENFVDGDGQALGALEHFRYSFVTVCGPPEPQFGFENMGGLDYRLLNNSVIAPYCLDTSKWSVFRGREAQGEPVFEFFNWEPRFELPAEGAWTVRLDHEGLGGAASAERIILAEYKLADAYAELLTPACANAPGGVGLLALSLLAAAARRRR